MPHSSLSRNLTSQKEIITQDWFLNEDIIYLESADLRFAKVRVVERSGWLIKIRRCENGIQVPFKVGDELSLKVRQSSRCVFCSVTVHSSDSEYFSLELPMVGTSYGRRAFDRMPTNYVGSLDGNAVQFVDISLAGACLKTNAASCFRRDQIVQLNVITFTSNVRIMGVENGFVRIQFPVKSVFDRELHFLLRRAHRELPRQWVKRTEKILAV